MSSQGSLTLIIGPMFSGKTTKLLRTHNDINFMKKINNCSDKKLDILVNFLGDTRYGESSKIITHDGLSMECIATDKLDLLWKTHFLSAYKNQLIDNIFINEGQFFSDIYEFVTYILDNTSINIYIAALDSDYKREKFGNIWNLIPHASYIDKLSGQCKFCKNKSIYTLRTTKDNTQTLISSEIYEPVCRVCYLDKNSLIN